MLRMASGDERCPPATEDTIADDWPSLDVLCLRYIAAVIEQSGGDKTRAADVLGIERRSLNRILARERAKAAKRARYRQLARAAKATSGDAVRMGKRCESS